MLAAKYAAMREGDALSDSPVSGNYVRNVHNEVNLVYKTAVREGRAASNPAALARPPRRRRPPGSCTRLRSLAAVGS